MGSFRISAPESDEKKAEFRRSVVITRDLLKGTELEIADFEFKRPGIGLPPESIKYLVGRKVSKNLSFDHILTLEDIE